MAAEPPAMYHEKQSLQRCALHTLNNFFQEARFTKAHLDQICYELSDSFINPHKSMFGLGNYDINVLSTAFQQAGYACVWFDRRRDPRRDLNLEVIEGFVVNTREKRMLMSAGRHWYCIRKIQNQFFNFDSKLQKPAPVSDPLLLAHQLLEKPQEDTQLFVICRETDSGAVYVVVPTVSEEPSASEPVDADPAAAGAIVDHDIEGGDVLLPSDGDEAEPKVSFP